MAATALMKPMRAVAAVNVVVWLTIMLLVRTDIPSETKLQAEIQLLILKGIFYLASIVKIILGSRLYINTHLWDNIVLQSYSRISRPLHFISLAALLNPL